MAKIRHSFHSRARTNNHSTKLNQLRRCINYLEMFHWKPFDCLCLCFFSANSQAKEEKCVTTDKFQNVYLDRRSLIYHSNTGKDETNLLRTQQPTKQSNRMINRMIRNGVIFELPNGGNSFLIRRLSNL